MALRAGQVVTLKVEREAEFGVFLSDGKKTSYFIIMNKLES